MFAGRETASGEFRARVVGRGRDYPLDVRQRQQLGRVGVGALDVEAGGLTLPVGRVRFGNRHELRDARNVRRRLQMRPGNAASADQSQFHVVHGC
jgi:hypothetical protein